VGLHVWKLTGPANTWEPQLQEHLAAEPVFAVLSGIGGKTWAPVHRFLRASRTTCLFPNVELPVVAENDFHSLYFSRGVLLESRAHCSSTPGTAPLVDGAPAGAGVSRGRYRRRSGNDARRRVAPIGLEIVRAYSGRRGGFGPFIRPQRHWPGDDLVLWLRPKDLAALGNHPVKADGVWMSG